MRFKATFSRLCSRLSFVFAPSIGSVANDISAVLVAHGKERPLRILLYSDGARGVLCGWREMDAGKAGVGSAAAERYRPSKADTKCIDVDWYSKALLGEHEVFRRSGSQGVQEAQPGQRVQTDAPGMSPSAVWSPEAPLNTSCRDGTIVAQTAPSYTSAIGRSEGNSKMTRFWAKKDWNASSTSSVL